MITQGQLEAAQSSLRALREAIDRTIVGHTCAVDVTLWTVLSRGHLLLEGVPGVGKTLLVRTLSHALGLAFSRIQFTPDLMPADILGTNMFAPEDGGFRFLPGPLFAHVVLADEVNRATPKTQSALLEAMQEGQVTIAGQTHVLAAPFVVLATQNPIEMEGTYPLPEAQVDRFLFKAEVGTPDRGGLNEIVRRNTQSGGLPLPEPVMRVEDVLGAQEVVSQYPLPEPLVDYASRLVLAAHPGSEEAPELVRRYVQYGPSPRGALALVWGAKARAFLDGRYHVSLSDIQAAAQPSLVHRVLLNFRGEAEGISPTQIVQELLRIVPAP